MYKFSAIRSGEHSRTLKDFVIKTKTPPAVSYYRVSHLAVITSNQEQKTETPPVATGLDLPQAKHNPSLSPSIGAADRELRATRRTIFSPRRFAGPATAMCFHYSSFLSPSHYCVLARRPILCERAPDWIDAFNRCVCQGFEVPCRFFRWKIYWCQE
jgi:hypothetical protein